MKQSAFNLAALLVLLLPFTQVAASGEDRESLSQGTQMQAREKVKPGTVSKVFASHPPLESRIAKTQKQLETKLPARNEYVVTRSEFDEVRTRLPMLENRRQLPGEEKEKKPTLRRTPQKTQGSNNEDDRPTLRRREN